MTLKKEKFLSYLLSKTGLKIVNWFTLLAFMYMKLCHLHNLLNFLLSLCVFGRDC